MRMTINDDHKGVRRVRWAYALRAFPGAVITECDADREHTRQQRLNFLG
jgi:hypothetical protein